MKLELFGGPQHGGWSAHGEHEGGIDPEIAPCPFCRETSGLVCENTHTPYYRVRCNSCGAAGPTNDIGDAWSRRMSKRAVEGLHRESFAIAIKDWNFVAQQGGRANA